MKNEKSALSHSLEMAEDKAKYDMQIKNILANKPILAWILRCTTLEFAGQNIEDIIDCIEGEPEIASVSVYPGKTNISHNDSGGGRIPKIIGMSTESAIPGEGEVTFDIRFHAYAPNICGTVKLIVNIEAQKVFSPGYDLVTRAVFYGARSLSAQKDTEFVHDDYDDIKKVYSIWICMECPSYVRNTITAYRMVPDSVYGNYNGERSRYDLLEVVMVCLGKDSEKSSNKLLRLLDVLLSNELSGDSKKEILTNEFAIDSMVELDKEVNLMCNLSDLVEERGINIGMSQTLIDMVDNLTKKTGFEEACELLEVSTDDYELAKIAVQEYRTRRD